jgi:bacterioferritin-associated ferredoxin
MACTPYPQEPPPPYVPTPRPMTRCECAEVSFEDAAAHLRAHGGTIEELARKTGCGGNCSACIPDLERFLARSR